MAKDDEVRYIAAALRRLETIVDRLEALGVKLDQATLRLEEYASVQELLRDITTEFPGQIDELRTTLIHILETLEHQSSSRLKTSQLKESLQIDRRDSLKRQLLRQHQTLNMLQEEAAKRGPTLDITLTTQIIDTQREIQRLEQQLALHEK